MLKDIAPYYNRLDGEIQASPDYPYRVHNGLWFSDKPYNHMAGLRVMEDFIELTSETEGARFILDAGCGTGPIAFRLARNNPSTKVVGINICDSQLLRAQSIKNARQQSHQSGNLPDFSFGDYTQLPFQPHAFDRVLFIDSISHSDDIPKTLQQTAEVMSFDGKVVVFDYFLRHQQDSINPDVVAFQELWKAPGAVPIDLLKEILHDSLPAFQIIDNELTSHVLPSVEHLSKRRLPKLTDGAMCDGAKLLFDLMQNGKVGYYGIVAKK